MKEGFTMNNFIAIMRNLGLITTSYATSIEDKEIVLNSSTQTTSSGIFSIIMFMFLFIFIATTLVFLFIILKKTSDEQVKANKSISVLDKINLDADSSLLFVELQDKVLVLAKSTNSINKVEEISDPEKIALLKLDCLNKKEVTFKSILAEQISLNNKSLSQKNLTDGKAQKY